MLHFYPNLPSASPALAGRLAIARRFNGGEGGRTTEVPFRGRLKTARDFNPANLKIPRT